MLPASQRPADTGVIAGLLAQPSRFDFFQALRLLLAWLREHNIDEAQAFAHCLRLHGSTALAFAPAQIEQLWLEHNDELVVHLRAAMVGYLGVHGALPLHDTVTLLRHARETGNEGVLAWLDCLSQRGLAQFYQCWARYRIECHGVHGGEFLQLQLALAGGSALPPEQEREQKPEQEPEQKREQDRSGLPVHAVAHYAAVLRHRPVTASVMQAVLAEYFGVQTTLQPLVGAWITRPVRERTCLVFDAAPLGGGAMLGRRCRRADLRLRMVLGPLTRAQHNDFLPGHPGALALRQMLGLFGLPSVSIEVRLMLRREDIAGCTLGASTSLGREAFLLAGQSSQDRDDQHYLVRFDGSA